VPPLNLIRRAGLPSGRYFERVLHSCSTLRPDAAIAPRNIPQGRLNAGDIIRFSARAGAPCRRALQDCKGARYSLPCGSFFEMVLRGHFVSA
jgi:hypothetical protein